MQKERRERCSCCEEEFPVDQLKLGKFYVKNNPSGTLVISEDLFCSDCYEECECKDLEGMPID